MKPLVSVIVPCFNERELIGDCVESLKRQNYENVEIIVVDDKSTDGSAEIAEKLGVRVIRMKEKGFHGGTRQKGADAAKGKIMVQCEADAHYPGNYVAEVTKPIIDGECDATAISLIKRHRKRYGILADFWEIKRLASHELKKQGKYEIKGAVAMKKAAFEKVGGYRVKSVGEDVDLANRMREAGFKICPVFTTWFHHADPATIAKFASRVYWSGDEGTSNAGFLKRWDKNYYKKEALAILLNAVFAAGIAGVLCYPLFGWVTLTPILLSFAIEGVAPLVAYNQYKLMPSLAFRENKKALFLTLPFVMYLYMRLNVMGRSARFLGVSPEP